MKCHRSIERSWMILLYTKLYSSNVFRDIFPKTPKRRCLNIFILTISEIKSKTWVGSRSVEWGGIVWLGGRVWHKLISDVTFVIKYSGNCVAVIFDKRRKLCHLVLCFWTQFHELFGRESLDRHGKRFFLQLMVIVCVSLLPFNSTQAKLITRWLLRVILKIPCGIFQSANERNRQTARVMCHWSGITSHEASA